MSDFIQRVHEAKARYTQQTGDWPDQLFLGPKEYAEFNEMCREYAKFSATVAAGGLGECAGMTIIGLMSDGLRVGRTVE
jgi:hypothetical protein